MFSPTLIVLSVTCAAALGMQGIALVNQIRHNAKLQGIVDISWGK